MAATIDKVTAYTWHCDECEVESTDLTESERDIRVMMSFHDQLNHKGS